MVINNKENETLYIDEPKGDKPTDSSSNNKKKDGKKKRCIKKIIYYDSDATSSSPREDDDDDSSSKKKTVNRTTRLTILACHTIQMHIYFQFPLENLHTLMERTIRFGVVKCIVIYSLSILAFGIL